MIHQNQISRLKSGFEILKFSIDKKEWKNRDYIMKFDDIQAIFFDFDGVILDSTRVKDATFQVMFKQYGETIVKKVLEHHRYHGGISRVEKIRHYYQEYLQKPLSKDELKQQCSEFSDRVKQKVIDSPWIEGIEDFLKKWYTRLPLFIISGTPQDELVDIVKAREMENFFLQKLGSPIKKPEHVRMLLKKYRLIAGKCIFIGDALTDYNAAMETGTKFIGIQGNIEFPDSVHVLKNGKHLEKAIISI